MKCVKMEAVMKLVEKCAENFNFLQYHSQKLHFNNETF